jgi:hypothetical protein
VLQTLANADLAQLQKWRRNMKMPVMNSAAKLLLRYGLIVAVLMQLGACAQSQVPASNLGAAQATDAKLAAPLAEIREKRQSKENYLEYRGSLPYNGEPPGYYGSSGNAFTGGP